MQSTLPEIWLERSVQPVDIQANHHPLDLDWLGQQRLADLDGCEDALLELLARAQSDLGPDDPFGSAFFGPDTPLVVILRALARLARAAEPSGGDG